MLFDLKSGKRRRVVQVVFGFLAFIFFISFVGFGIGSGASGGLFDAIGLGGDDTSQDASAETQFQPQIDQAEAKLEKDPKDAAALEDLARYRYLAGQAQLELDDNGAATITEGTRSDWGDALDAWEKFLTTDPKEVDVQVASQLICAYVPPMCFPLSGDPGTVDFDSAAKTAELVADREPSAQSLGQLAYLQLAGGHIEEGTNTSEEAIAEASGSESKDLQKQFDKLIKQATDLQKAQEKAQKAGSEGGATPGTQLQNPFGSLGSDTGTGVPPAGP